MRIAWFTPFSTKSAIGYYSKLACDELCKSHEVTIYTPVAERYHESQNEIIELREILSAAQLKKYDICFYNIGDNTAYHALIFDQLKAVPGVAILHDISVINFIYGYFMQHKNNLQEYVKTMAALYGSAAAEEIVMASQSHEKWNELDAVKYNFIRYVTQFARGVIVHSRYHQHVLQQEYDGPSKVIYFPYVSEVKVENFSDKVVKEKQKQLPKIKVLTVGAVNPNKRVAQVIIAIGTDSILKERVQYTVAGGLNDKIYEQKLRKLAREYSIEGGVILEGFTTDERLKELYSQADILCNLRKPAVEGASWSLVEQMDCGKPIIVANVGFYAEMPDQCLIKIDTDENEIQNIQKALRWVLENEQAATNKGNKAKEFLEENFSPQIYVENLLEFIEELVFLKPCYQLLDNIIYELDAIGVSSELQTCNMVAQQMEELFGNLQ